MSNSGKLAAASKNKRRLIWGLFTSFLLLVAFVSLIIAVTSRTGSSKTKNSHQHQPAAHAVIKSSCSSTLYPDLCFSQLSSIPEATSKIMSTKNVIDLHLNLTKVAVEHNFFSIKKLSESRRSFTPRDKIALHDCLEMVDETLIELQKIIEELKEYPSPDKSVREHADDLKTLLSAAMTNQDTCLDGFSHDKADKTVRQLILSGQMNAFRMCSNSLAMVKNLTDTDMANEQSSSKKRKLDQLEDGNGDHGPVQWPKWLSAGDRRLLQSTSLTPNVVVAADGSGDYSTVSAAVAAAPSGSKSRYIIRIKAGDYKENVEVPKGKTNLMFVGDGRKTTVITGSRNVVDGSTTFNSATVAVVGEGFLAKEITFQNTAGPSKHQAVALRVNADLTAFYRCDMLGYQDTLYVHSLRQFYINCFIAGTVDFIFGNAEVVLQDCDIHARKPNAGQRNMVTAQGRDDPNQNTGIVIQKCRIGATSDLLPVQDDFPTYFGRPWKEYSRTIVMQTAVSDVINPAGWYMWDGDFALSTLYYAEYANTGAGADTSNRVTWAGYHVLTSASEAQPFTARYFIAGASWLPATGFPYSLDL